MVAHIFSLGSLVPPVLGITSRHSAVKKKKKKSERLLTKYTLLPSIHVFKVGSSPVPFAVL